MLAGALTALAALSLLASLALLALAPRLRLFDDQRRRGFALVAMLVVVGLLGVAALWAVRRETAERASAASGELYDALRATGAATLVADAAAGRPLPGGATSVAELQGGGVAAYRPVEVLWARWCVVGTIAVDGRVTVDRIHRRCP
jgi:type II secretory pathway pseudopilin PulG